MCGRLRVGKSFLHVLQDWSVQPCVRPSNAVHMTAGHNALRGSGPDQTPAFDDASTQVGCPDRRIDRLCITCCSPSQPSLHAGYPARSRLRRKRASVDRRNRGLRYPVPDSIIRVSLRPFLHDQDPKRTSPLGQPRQAHALTLPFACGKPLLSFLPCRRRQARCGAGLP